MKELTHHFANVNGVNLHFVRQGEGKELVVLLHGWPEFWYSWRFQIPALAEKYTVVAPDLRGFNLSDKPLGVENYQTQYVIRDIRELIEQLGFKQAYIVGHDWGGAVAWHFATAFPEMTTRLAILNCPHPKLMIRSLLTNLKQLKRSWYMISFQIPFLPELILGQILEQFFKANMRGWLFNSQNMTDEDIQIYVRAYREKDALTTSISYYRAGLRYGIDQDLKNKKVQVPTRVIWGKNDKALGVELNDHLDEVIDASHEVIFLDRCSHWIQMDQPKRVSDLLLEFFGQSNK
ncbi:MAG: alpha/beta hydrolase [Chitinophagales bacterium]|nr:alpha/beta hydrolase [Chitinophagales bacterium]